MEMYVYDFTIIMVLVSIRAEYYILYLHESQ